MPNKKSTSYEDFLSPRLQEDRLARDYLNECLADDDPRVFLTALRDVVNARENGMRELAQKAGLNRESLYRVLSNKGNPEWKTLVAILNALGFHLSVRETS